MTIIEMMIVITIILVLLSIAVPSYVKIRTETKARVCKANLKQIDSAIEQWSFEYDVREGTLLTPYEEEIYSYIIAGKPSCPSGGNYILRRLGANPQVRCSSNLEGHEYP